MKKVLWAIVIILLLIAGFASWKIFGPTVHVPAGKYFYVHTTATYDSVMADLQKDSVISSKTWFDFVAKRLHYKTIRPGKYEIKKGMSIFELVRILKNGKQTPVNFVIIKFRTKSEFAHRVGKEFETDSLTMMNFLSNNDSLKNYGVDTNTWACDIIPDTYTYFWNSTPTKIFSKLHTAAEKFWNDERKQKAKEHGLTPEQVYILASIIEEETNLKTDKANMASVYINRLSKQMPLQADPTLKFALKNFAATRVYNSFKEVESPYNTYKNTGLPPGPICTPSVETLDEVLNAPKTDYLYFVANSDLNGGSVFTSSYEEHMKYAKMYQHSLDVQDSIRKARQDSK